MAGGFASVQELKDPIADHSEKCNRAPKTDRWKLGGGDSAKIQRARQAVLTARRWILVNYDSLHWDRPVRAVPWQTA